LFLRKLERENIGDVKKHDHLNLITTKRAKHYSFHSFSNNKHSFSFNVVSMAKENPTPTITLKPVTWVLPYRTEKVTEIYRMGRKLGQGQFGTTYLCTHKSTNKRFACKSIPKRKLFCKEDYEDVWREIQIMHHLSEHPHVVRIEGTYEDSTAVHIVMELCEGGELFDRIVKKGHYSERQAAGLIKTIVEVVESCHSLGVMHRDLKPENFLFDTVDEDAKLKATDFGLSVFYKPGRVFILFLLC